MDFSHSEERQLFKDMAARYIADKYKLEARNKAAETETGFSPDHWAQFAELGLIGALFTEEAGGFGGSPFDVTVLFEELGRGLVNEPLLATAVLGGGLIADLGNDAQKAVLEEVIAGTHQLAFAHGEPKSRYDASHVETTAESGPGNGYVLNGAKAVVLNGGNADTLIVSARTSGKTWDEDGISLFLVPKGTAGVSVRSYPSIDGLHAAEVTLDKVELPADALLGEAGKAYPAIEKVLARGAMALASEAVGIMEVCRDMTIDYLKTRKQFGVEIGRFQALQHRMATVLLEIEQARSAVINAAGHFNENRVARERAVSAAKTLAGKVGKLVAEEAIQMHGGIAMTWEYAVGHFAKRLIMIDHQLGDVDYHTARYVALSKAA
ncbi:acyl-CoA dehydrogenase family protein [Rhizobium sp. L1K21]|uniref:acyl-CoA dehydrogenase family protein n=1 Tax=Rhizobium sp. L1K21 TaxID=2954933 RepID=UPI0020920E63|nr:acyl-CoA dehydrogenase [Rhizobium sp. L1K21]MCO6188321.1 acyl-CoA dehydrogenase [Rhizobium sp. L1K21]